MALFWVYLSRLWTRISCKYDWWYACSSHQLSMNVLQMWQPHKALANDFFPDLSVAKQSCPTQAQCSTKWIGLKRRFNKHSNKKSKRASQCLHEATFGKKTLDFWMQPSFCSKHVFPCSFQSCWSLQMYWKKTRNQRRWYLIAHQKNCRNRHSIWRKSTFGHLGTELPSNHQLCFHSFHP